MTKVHLDTDLGGDIDDLCALAMLLNWPDIEVVGITTVAEDNGKRSGYVQYVTSMAERDGIPIAAGADISTGCYRSRPGFQEGLGYWPKGIARYPGPVEGAIELLKQSIQQNAIILGIGPYTNLYLLDRQYPGLLQRANLYLMGGYVVPPRDGFPQWGNDMDYNIQADILSAKHVLENSSPTLVPLSVTVETYLRRSYLRDLQKSGPLGNLIARQARAFARDWNNEEIYGKRWGGLPDDLINFQHDPLACAIALGWREGVEIREIPLKLEIADGWLHEIIDENGKPTQVVVSADGDQFSDFWLKTVTRSV